MKKTITHLRTKSPEVRLAIAVTLAAAFTILIGAGWVMSLSSGPAKDKAKHKAPSPLSTFAGNVKDVIVNPGKNTEIIDAGATDTLHDESNPYQTPQDPESVTPTTP